MYLNHPIPPFECYVRMEYLYNLESHFGEIEEVTPFGIRSVIGQALLFSVMTKHGAIYDKIPISSMIHKTDAPKRNLSDLQMWDCSSYNVSVVKYPHLKNKRARAYLKDGSTFGRYLFTVDWTSDCSNHLDVGFSEITGEHKSGHFIALEDGNFCLQPNNRILWADPGFTTNPFGGKPDYLRNHQIYSCEMDNWCTDDSEHQFYELQRDYSSK